LVVGRKEVRCNQYRCHKDKATAIKELNPLPGCPAKQDTSASPAPVQRLMALQVTVVRTLATAFSVSSSIVFNSMVY
jgi:hypothetical protein